MFMPLYDMGAIQHHPSLSVRTSVKVQFSRLRSLTINRFLGDTLKVTVYVAINRKLMSYIRPRVGRDIIV